MIYNNLLDLIGNTPVVKLNFKDENIADVCINFKIENFFKFYSQKNSLTF